MTHACRVALLAAIAMGCDSAPRTGTPPPPCVVSETLTIGTLLVELESDVGTVRGVDLDGRESDADDRRGCYHEDWLDPDGSSVDDNFALLGPTIEAAYEVDPRRIFSHDGLTLTVEGRGEGVCGPVDVTLADGPTRSAEWNGSTLRAYDLGDVPLQLTLPGSSGSVVLHDAAVRMTLTVGQRIATIVLSGGVEVDELVAVAAESSIVLDEALVRTSLEGIADLEPDAEGYCTRLSISLEAQPPT